MKINEELIHREIAGEHILVPLGEVAQHFSGLFSMNELATFLWEMLPMVDDEATLVELVLEQYDVERETAESDVHGFLQELREKGFIE